MIKKIRQALETALNTWASAQSPAVPVAWQNRAYTPTLGARYVQANILPAETENPSLGDDHKRFIGIFQVLIYSPDNKGAGDAETLAESLFTTFARGESFAASTVTVRILDSPSVLPSFNDNGWYVLPVSIRYQSDIY
jgi:hypothetical protein